MNMTAKGKTFNLMNPSYEKKRIQKLIPGTYLNYSVTAITPVTVYVISGEDLNSKLPKDILRLILS